MPQIPFHRPALAGTELQHLREALESSHLHGDGPFTKRCELALSKALGGAPALLVHSCTAALEMAAMLLDLGPGDEIIMPSFTFVSTANAFAMRGAVPVFVDIRGDTMNLDVERAADAITAKTKAIVPVHYAGIGCDMHALVALARPRGLAIIEDAAQAFGAAWDGQALGTFGRLGALSFHGTKNVTCGEGGALIINDRSLVTKAEILREKGTDRKRFLRGEVDRYTWQSVGSSYIPSDLLAAVLFAQLEAEPRFRARRLALWHRYAATLAPAVASGDLELPIIPERSTANGHIFAIRTRDPESRDALVSHLGGCGIQALTHYVALHDSPAGKRLGRAAGSLPVTSDVIGRLLRLPLYPGLTEAEVELVAAAVNDFFIGRRAVAETSLAG